MDIDNGTTKNKLREIMYSALGYQRTNDLWHKKERKIKHSKSEIQCSKCMEYFDREFLIQRGKKNFCNECEKTIV